MDIKLNIIIVSWNCESVLRDCLLSLGRAKLEFSYEIVLVDNASADGTVAMVRAEFPAVRIIENSENVGFAAANNAGISLTNGEYILLLNPDTVVEESASLHRLAGYLDLNPGVAAAGCRLLNENGTHQVGDAGFSPSLASVACHSLFLNKLFRGGCNSVFLTGRQTLGDALSVDWICGACIIFRRSIIPIAGLMREDIFMYGEDMEWGCRMRRAGLAIHYLPDIHITHIQGGTQNPVAPTSTTWIDGLARCFYELNAPSHWPLFKACLVSGFALRLAAYLLMYAASWGSQAHWSRQQSMRAYLLHSLKLKASDFRGDCHEPEPVER